MFIVFLLERLGLLLILARSIERLLSLGALLVWVPVFSRMLESKLFGQLLKMDFYGGARINWLLIGHLGIRHVLDELQLLQEIVLPIVNLDLFLFVPL